MIIEEYKDHDPQKIIQLIVTIQQDELGVKITGEDQPDLKNIQSFYQKGNGNFWIATDGNKIAGTIALVDIGNNEAVLRKMFVHPEYRGSDKVVSSSLMTTLLGWCQSKKIRTIYLGTIDIMKAAHRFYEKNGFREITKKELPPTFPVMKVDNVFYKLDLQ
jgi:N-acetylglutamate synthase-like GNAT family acetyltransferase